MHDSTCTARFRLAVHPSRSLCQGRSSDRKPQRLSADKGEQGLCPPMAASYTHTQSCNRVVLPIEPCGSMYNDDDDEARG